MNVDGGHLELSSKSEEEAGCAACFPIKQSRNKMTTTAMPPYYGTGKNGSVQLVDCWSIRDGTAAAAATGFIDPCDMLRYALYQT